jgi:hypothetical protein
MANIIVKDLAGCNIAGEVDLLNDSESFMRSLSNDEFNIQGANKVGDFFIGFGELINRVFG